ncbi:MAG: choice-of-anchor V domain-containing protein [Bacteroidota bacterium]
MKNKYLFIVFLGVISSIAFNKQSCKDKILKESFKNSHLRFTSGAPTGRTGAPGEGNCTSCHAGTVQTNSALNVLEIVEDGTTNVVTQYEPGVTYKLTLTINSTAVKKGFQALALKTSNNTQAGTMTAVQGSTSLTSASSKVYVNHTSNSTTAASFSFKWTAPLDNVGDVKFYIASNSTNNQNNSSGDVIRLSQHTISPVPIDPPVSSFTSSATQICAGSSITFTNTSTGNPTSILWSFTDGTPSSSTEENPTVIFSNSGTFNVSLSTTNVGGSDESLTSITVQNCASLDEKLNEILLLYPNPVEDEFTLKNIDLVIFSKVELLDLNGKIIQDWNISKKEENFSLQGIESGSYLIKIKGTNSELIKAILIK